MSHTPTPWQAKQHSAHSGGWYVIGAEGLVVAAGLTKPDAQFIEAAPLMLEALKGLLANAPKPKRIKDDFSYTLYLEAARTAIAKAEGRDA